MIHELKCWPEFFGAIASGTKRFELRKTTDRAFAVGDVLHLREYDPNRDEYSGHAVFVDVTYVVNGKAPWLPHDVACLSIALRGAP